MEPNFQTSFIPKKPMIESRAVPSRSIGILTVISVFIFITMLVVTGGIYFYKGIVGKSISKMENDLNLAKNRFEPSRLQQLQVLDKRLRASSKILSGHISISPIFEVLGDITMKTVRYTQFDYDLEGVNAQRVNVKMKGMAVGYRSIALQSDLFAKNKNLIDPVFSNLSLDDKGNVVFDLDFSVDPSFVNYQQLIRAQIQAGDSGSGGTMLNNGDPIN